MLKKRLKLMLDFLKYSLNHPNREKVLRLIESKINQIQDSLKNKKFLINHRIFDSKKRRDQFFSRILQNFFDKTLEEKENLFKEIKMKKIEIENIQIEDKINKTKVDLLMNLNKYKLKKSTVLNESNVIDHVSQEGSDAGLLTDSIVDVLKDKMDYFPSKSVVENTKNFRKKIRHKLSDNLGTIPSEKNSNYQQIAFHDQETAHYRYEIG